MTNNSNNSLTRITIHSHHFLHDGFYFGIIAVRIVRLLEISTEKESDGLPETCRETSLQCFDNVIAICPPVSLLISFIKIFP